MFSEVGFGQTPAPQTEATSEENSENFSNLGYISFSDKYTISKNAKNIVFRIRNNATRSISKIYAWVYEVSKEEGTAYRLVNNPNQGGLPVKGGVHAPGTIVDWRFPLTAADQNKTEVEYTLRASHRSIFFTNLEPPKSVK